MKYSKTAYLFDTIKLPAAIILSPLLHKVLLRKPDPYPSFLSDIE